VGIWIGFSIALGTYVILLIGRFHLLTARQYLPAAI
jgi:hypothetical protein